MKTKSLFHRGLPLFAIISLLGTVALAQNAVTDKIKLSVVSITRVSEYPPAPNSTLKPGEGNEFVVVELMVTAPSADDVYKEAKLVDSDGVKHSSVTSSVDFPPGKKQGTQTFVFSIAKGTKLKGLVFGKKIFDLPQIQ